MVLPRFSSRVFIVLGLMFKSLIHLELISMKNKDSVGDLVAWSKAKKVPGC